MHIFNTLWQSRFHSLRILLYGVLLAMVWERAALAYIDPATSGTLMQIIAPILIALGVLRQRIKHAFHLLLARVRRGRDHDDRA